MSSFINTKYAQKNLSEDTNINDWEEEFKKSPISNIWASAKTL
jgi:hypothetical protein